MATYTAGEVAVNFIARTLGFDKNVDKSKKKVKQFSRTAKNLGDSLKAAMGPLGIGIGVSAVAALGSRVLQTSQEIDVLAKRSSLSAEEFQKFGQAARQQGFSLEHVSDVFHDMNERVAEFATRGTGEGADALKALGLSAKAFNSDVVHNLTTIVEKAESLASAGEKTLVYNEIFGDAGAKVLMAMGENLAKAAESQKALFSNEQLKRLKEARDLWKQISASITTASAGAISMLVQGGGAGDRSLKGRDRPGTSAVVDRRTREEIGLEKIRQLRGGAQEAARQQAADAAAARLHTFTLEQGLRARRGGDPLSVQRTRGAIGAMSTPEEKRTASATERTVTALEAVQRILDNQTVVMERGFEAETDFELSDL